MLFIVTEDPIQKSYVQGHFIVRNGQKYWIKPYENRRTKKPADLKSVKKFKKYNDRSFQAKPKKDEESNTQHPKKYQDVTSEGKGGNNFLLDFALETADNIHKFEDGEKANFDDSLKNCKTIVSNLGYLDDGVAHLFKPSESKPEPIAPKKVRTIRAINKEAKKIYLRVNDSKMKQQIAGIIENTKI